MESLTLKSRAIAFATCAGAIGFVLALAALAALSRDAISIGGAGSALVAAILCGMLCWVSAARLLATTATAIDAAIHRMAKAAAGDLQAGIPRLVRDTVPSLANAMDGLFRQLRDHMDQLQQLALFDPVTGLANRASFRQAAEEMIATLPDDAEAALFFIDLDRFKTVNDTLGHANGDALLAMVANRLRAVAETCADGRVKPPLLGRLAGDEFTMFFPHLTDAEDAARIGRSILFAMAESFDLADQRVMVGASIGAAVRPHHGGSLAELMRAADAAMYHAKAQGRGRVEHFSEQLAVEIAGRAELEMDLRRAIERREFELYFQPLVQASDGSLMAAEALLRWRHATGLRTPSSFIDRAEESGLIVEIGEWAIDEIAATLARWAHMGVEQRLTMNISRRQLDHAQFFRRLRQALTAWGAPARLLELEITETLAMHCSNEMIKALAALRADGATIALDDFGTGYSKLTRLRDLPIDRIKLDPSLITHIVDRAEARAVAQAVIGLIHGLGCEAVAEGIESDAQADVLRVIGCDLLQGYAIARPMPEASFLRWCAQERGQRKTA